ncbi:MAG: hypothetical protein PHN48_01190 [Parabacteroides sp.]|jgi:hypothetical protein|nr:hypothetical protein [Parabacteroides sp.]
MRLEEYTDEDILNRIMEVLERYPTPIKLEEMLFKPLKMDVSSHDAYRLRKKLVILGLITEAEDIKGDTPVSLTKEGMLVMIKYKRYTNYLEAIRKESETDAGIKSLTKANIRLKNLNIAVGLLSFTAGILLSDPVKDLLLRWLLSGK